MNTHHNRFSHPISQAIRANGLVFSSGCIGVDSQGKLVGDTLEAQALQVCI